MLTSYEVEVAFGGAEWTVGSAQGDGAATTGGGGAYPMDYYSGSGGSWANYALANRAPAPSIRWPMS